MEEPRSILVIKPSSLGDVVHTLPAVACVRRKWPDARIAWVVNPEWAPLLAGNRDIDEVIEFPRRKLGGLFGWMRFPGWVRELRGRVKPDLVIDFQGLLRSALIGRMSGGDVWGTSDSREGARWLHHHVVRVPGRGEPVHAVTRTLALVAGLGCDISGEPRWALPEGNAPAGDLPERFVLLHPFSRGTGKSLTAAEVTAFCAALAPVPVVLAGRSDESVDANAVNLLNATTLPELCWLIRRAAFVVSVDSGPMHMAAALNKNLLAIHTWSDPRQVGPFSQQAWVWKDGRVGRKAEFPAGGECPRAELGAWVGGQLEKS